MNKDLSLNPFTAIISRNEECLLISPKIETGLLCLEIPKSQKPELYELFSDLSKLRLDFLDIVNDLNDEERALLYEYGVLIEPENIPQKPLFACPLDDVEAADFDVRVSDLFVNPAFRFEPVNLANFHSWIQEKSLSPHQNSVWIKTSSTGIETGYWLDENQTEILSKFNAGEKPDFQIEQSLLNKLVAAEILASAEIIKEREAAYKQDLMHARSDFRKKKYVNLRNILPAPQMAAMRSYYRQYIGQGFMEFGDSQVNRRFYQHNEPLARFFHKNLTNLMSSIAGEEVIPSYVYAASYREGAMLTPHIDREACEFSFSFQIDYFPEQENHLSPWALYLSTKKIPETGLTTFDWKDFPEETNSEDINAFYLSSGDCLAYKGCELTHYRYALPAGHQSTSLFFHYVPKDFKGELI